MPQGINVIRILIRSYILTGTAAKEMQDTSCRGSGGVPQLQRSPKIGGYRGLIESISAAFHYIPIAL
jgi:hypothetical protein